MATATTAVLTQTLANLRERVARRLGDFDQLTATSNGTTTTFIDALNVNSASESMLGRFITMSSGTVHRITVFTDGTSTVTFTPAAASTALTATGSVVSVYNKRGKGFSPAQYKSAINDAINDAWPLGMIEIISTISGSFDSTTPEVTVPASMYRVHTVEWQDTNGDWHVILKASRSNESGWRADAAAGQIRLQGVGANQADGFVIRLTGYGRQDELSADSDTCALNAEYIVARACYHLTYGNIERDEKYAQTTSGFMQESKLLRSRIRTMHRTDAEIVRSV